MTNFGKYKVFQSLCTSHTDFPHQQLSLPFLLPTPDIIGRSLEFLRTDIKYVVSWSEVRDQLDSFPCWREDSIGARKFWSNFYNAVVPWRWRNPPRNKKLDLSGLSLLSATPLPFPVFSVTLPPIFSSLLFLPLFRLGAQAVSFLLAVEAEFSPQRVFWLIQPHITHYWSWKDWQLR